MNESKDENKKTIVTDDILKRHREIVKKVILDLANRTRRPETINLEPIFDETNNCYKLTITGWEDGNQVNENLIYVELKGEGVIIKSDKTKKRFVGQLIKQGINKNYISTPTRDGYLVDEVKYLISNIRNILFSSIDISNKTARLRISGVFFFFLMLMGLLLALIPKYNWLFYSFDFSGISTFLTFGGILGLITWVILDNLSDRLTYITETSYQEAADRAAQSPSKAKPAWDMATATLSAYFNRNLKQVDWIFRLSVIVMFLGFGLVGFGIILTYQKPESVTVAIVGGIAGVITQFIGATFLFIYKSTISQANKYSETLAKINSVGMAMQILDGISDEERLDSTEKLVNAKIEIAKLLLANAQEIQLSNNKLDDKNNK